MKRIIFAAAMLCGSASFAHDYHLGDLSVAHPFSYTTAATAHVGAGYMTITNNGDTDDRLIAIEADFERVELHNVTVDDNGVAKMAPLADGIAIPAGATVELKSGGYHTMFIGLGGDPFELDERIPATLVFEKAGRLEVEFKVEERDGAAMDHSAHAGHGMTHGDHDAKSGEGAHSHDHN